MIGSRNLRSSKSLDTANAVPVSVDRPSKEKLPSIITMTEGTDKRRGPPHVKAIPVPSKTTEKSHNGNRNVNEDDRDTIEDSDEDEDDEEDAKAPSSDLKVPVNTIKGSPTDKSSTIKFRNSENKSWTGLNESNGALESTDGKNDDHILHGDTQTMNDNLDSSPITLADLIDEPLDSEESDFDIADDDDDYDAIDNMSNASDDSITFERDVEREIQAAGEDGIDWDQENTYHFDTSMNDDIFAFDADLHARLDAPLIDFPDVLQAIDEVTSANFQKMDRSMASDSDRSSILGGSHAFVPQPDTPSKPILKMETSFDNGDGDTTDEDLPFTNVSSPGITLSRANSMLGRKHLKSKRARNMSKSRQPSWKICRSSHKATSISRTTPYGIQLGFETPKGKTWAWKSVGRQDTQNSSGASSPTMINLEDAYTRGNTRSGAHITDVINGTLFSQLHCRTGAGTLVSNIEANHAVSKFYQSLLSMEIENQKNTPQIAASRPIEETASELIDFSGGANESSSSEDVIMIDNNEAGRANAQQVASTTTSNLPTFGVMAPASTADAQIAQLVSSETRVPITPPPEHEIVMNDATPALKRRKVEPHTAGQPSVCPSPQKQHHTELMQS